MKISTKRTLVRLSVFVLVGIGVAFNIGTGTLSAIGFDNIAALCPLGGLSIPLIDRKKSSDRAEVEADAS